MEQIITLIPDHMGNKIFFYRKNGVLQRIKLEEVMFLEAADNYVKFVTPTETHTVRTSLEAALSQLPEDQFLQVHRSYAIAADQINILSKEAVSFRSFPDQALPVTKSYYSQLLQRINLLETGGADEAGDK